jgi:CRISPR-associated protein Cas1
MKHHLNTLFLTTDDLYLAKEGEAVLVRQEKQTKLRVPIHTLGSIVCMARVGVSPSLMGLCGERGVAISFLTPSGRFLARVTGFTPGNVLLRREQYRRADDPGASAAIARAMVAAKVANARSVLLRCVRDYPDAPGVAALQSAAGRMAAVLGDLMPADPASLPLDRVRGLEGEAGQVYFSVFDHLITAQKDAGFTFTSRSRRPPLDPVNALLSFLYAMLAHDARAACEAAGLDPAVGFLHRDRPGRPGLALDLMEEFRPYLADRLALSLINRRQVAAGDFVTTESGAVKMTDPCRKAVLSAYQRRKQEEVLHPYLGERVSVGLLVHLQARLLARFIRGDTDAYPAFVWK